MWKSLGAISELHIAVSSFLFDKPSKGVHYTTARLHVVEADQLCWSPSGRHFTEFEVFTNNFLGRNDTPVQYSCSLLLQSWRTMLILSAVIAVPGTSM